MPFSDQCNTRTVSYDLIQLSYIFKKCQLTVHSFYPHFHQFFKFCRVIIFIFNFFAGQKLYLRLLQDRLFISGYNNVEPGGQVRLFFLFSWAHRPDYLFSSFWRPEYLFPKTASNFEIQWDRYIVCSLFPIECVFCLLTLSIYQLTKIVNGEKMKTKDI
jgi:hypothetical protein